MQPFLSTTPLGEGKEADQLSTKLQDQANRGASLGFLHLQNSLNMELTD